MTVSEDGEIVPRARHGNRHVDACNSTACPCYQEGRRSVEVFHAHPGFMHSHINGADFHKHEDEPDAG